MSRMLAELLQAKEPLFSTSLRQLEKISSHEGRDVKLQAEIIEKFNRKVKQLGLDPKDSTGPEIYQALINQIKRHDQNLAKKIGASDDQDVKQAMPFIVEAINRTHMPRDCWAIKQSVAEAMLRKNPPNNIIKLLGYTSVDEMLSREDIFEIYSALRFAEDEQWLRNFNDGYGHLTADDFETRQIKLVVMPKDKWGDLAKEFIIKKKHLNTHLKEFGVVVILPRLDDKMVGVTTKVMSLTYHYYNEVRMYSAFFKLHRHNKNFGKVLSDTLNADPDTHAVLAGQNIHWRLIQRYFGKSKDDYHPEIFEPHLQPEDLHWRKAAELLYEVDSELDFWRDLEFVGKIYDGRPLTMNLVDILLSYSNAVGYDERYIYHFRESLWNEIFSRYMGSSVLRDQLLKQLDNGIVEPEKQKI